MNNTPPFVLNHKLSLLLKEKGFHEICFGYYLSKNLPYNKKGLHFGSSNYIGNHNNSDKFICSAPLIHQVTEWLRINHKIYVETSTTYNIHGLIHFCRIVYMEDNFCNSIIIKDENINPEILDIDMWKIFDNPESALSEGIKYVLTKILK